jgi:hypothetical protein
MHLFSQAPREKSCTDQTKPMKSELIRRHIYEKDTL